MQSYKDGYSFQDLENELLKWKDRALNFEEGFKEMQSLMEESDELRNLLERKVIDNQNLQHDNSRLRDRIQQLENDRLYGTGKVAPETERLGRDSQVKKLEEAIAERDSILLKCKRDIEALQRKSKKKEEELHRQYQIQIEDHQIQHKNDISDWSSERNNLKQRVQELEQTVQFKTEENVLILNELALNNEHVQELINHNKISVELRTKELREQFMQSTNQGQGQVKQLEDVVAQLKRSQDNNLSELQDLHQQKQQFTLKINDLTAMNQHLVLETEGLKQTLLTFQKQRDQDEILHEDSKKKETTHLKRYYETLLEQVERENRSLRGLLDQKSREIEELWSSNSRRF